MDTYGDVPLGVECAWPVAVSGDAAVGAGADKGLQPVLVKLLSGLVGTVLPHTA